jgi:gamma-glutamylaminecyclotransferase
VINLFVYGTLKKGRHNHDYLEGSEFMCDCHTNKDYTLIVSGLPFLVKREGQGCKGELYRINEDTLRTIDRLEGHPRFYKRETITVYDLETGMPIIAQTYIHPDIFNKKYLYDQKIERDY